MTEGAAAAECRLAAMSSAVSHAQPRSCWPYRCIPQWLWCWVWRCSVWLLLLLLQLHLPAGAAATANANASASACSTTFTAWEQSLGPLTPLRQVTFRCPPRCLLILPLLSPPLVPTNASNRSTPTSSPLSPLNHSVVRGSYPYSSDSSICLAAIHAGVVNATLGGAVFVSRFYRHDWSRSPTQSIFPFSSSTGSLSNGVHSLNVSALSYTVPSNGSEWSFIVRGRGELVRQRRLAPFPPRSGHAHVGYPQDVSFDQTHDTFDTSPVRPAYRSWHFIIGGHNGSHYLNDVWLAEPSDLTTNSDLQWRQLPPAPFSPRSDMRVLLYDEPTSEYSSDAYYLPVRVLLVGGQTGHRCGVMELGVCSSEVWSLTLNVSVPFSDARQSTLLSASWSGSDRPFAVLPFLARCGAALIASEAGPPTVALVAGQLSYSDDSCTSAPQAVNEVWRGSAMDAEERVNLSRWWRETDAPFSPRRSMQREDTLATLSAAHLSQLPSSSSSRHGCCPLVGGFRIVNLTHSNGLHSSTDTRIDSLEAFAGAWVCNLNSSAASAEGVLYRRECLWGWQRPMSADSANVSTTSVPIPTAFGSQATSRSGWSPPGQRFTGFTSTAAVQAWQHAAPASSGQAGATTVNGTVMARNPPDFGEGVSERELSQQRYGVPVSFIMREELRLSNSSLYSGTPWLSSHSPWLSPPTQLHAWETLLPSVSTLHAQPMSLAVEPAEASPYLPQAASSAATQRPHFRFPLARLEAGYDEWMDPVYERSSWELLYRTSSTVVSGGRASGVFLSDWVEMGEARCLPPDDPSFLPVLGPLQLSTSQASADPMEDASYTVMQSVRVRCAAHYHFEPRLQSAQVTLFCGPNGLWLDLDLSSVRVCVPNPPLNCTAPLVDLGGAHCELPRPFLSSLAAADGSGATQWDALTLMDFPVSAGNVLRIEGGYFSADLVVTVGGHQCETAGLSGQVQRLCYNRSSCDSQAPVEWSCADYATAITCVIPAVVGLNLAVLVTSGAEEYRASVVPDGRVATLSSTAPVVSFLWGWVGVDTNPVCESSDDWLALWDCPVQQPYNLTVCLRTASLADLTPSVYLGTSQSALSCVEYPRDDFSFNGWSDGRCLRCLVLPFLGRQEVRVQPQQLPLLSTTNASISSTTCPPGYATDVRAAFSGSAFDLCLPCDPGYSTQGARGVYACSPCRTGEYAAQANSSSCLPCQLHTFAAEIASPVCQPCPVNSLQPLAQSSSCVPCTDAYVRLTGDGLVNSSCADCPEGAECSQTGNVTAHAGSFLLIDPASATVSRLSCSVSACLDALDYDDDDGHPLSAQHAQRMAGSGVLVHNRCAEGRYPAYMADWEELGLEVLRPTAGVNVLCALCLPGYSQLDGVCVRCESVNGRLLFALLLALFALVLTLHRWPHNRKGKATLTVVGYFLQQSALFLSPSFYFMTLLNLDISGDSVTQSARGGVGARGFALTQCVWPTHTDADRVHLSLTLLMVVVLAMPALVALMQALAYLILRAWKQPPPLALRLYSLAFMAAPPAPQQRLSPPAEVPAAPFDALGKLGGPDGAEGQQLSSLAEPLWPRDSTSPRPRVRVWSAAVASEPVWLAYQRTFVRVLQLSYSSAALLSLALLNTRSVGVHGERLVDYPGLDPASSVYRHQLLPLIVPLLICVLSLPVLLTLLLWRLQRRHASRASSPMSSAVEPLDASGAGGALVQQLCGMFRPSYWWMAPCIPARRLLLAALFAFVPGSSVFVWATLVNYVLLAIHLQLQPFRRAQDNAIESVSLLLLSVQTSLLSGLHSPAGNTLLTLTMALLLLPPPLLTIAPHVQRLNRLRIRWIKARRSAAPPSPVGSVQMGPESEGSAAAPPAASDTTSA